MDKALAQQIKTWAGETGFELVGIASAQAHPHHDFFQNWIHKGYQADMQWLQRGAERRGDPTTLLDGAKTIICCGLNYKPAQANSLESKKPDHAWISCYAWGDDYHQIVLEKLNILKNKILLAYPETQLKAYVDTGPILERSYAHFAGLGWIGKNTCLIHPRSGSFFFIGVILTTLDLALDSPEPDHCGTCTRCIDACPTQALVPYELNAQQCISYLTIEHREAIAPELAKKMGHHVFGCDICQEVCPWNQKAPPTSEPGFQPRDGLYQPELNFLKNLTQENFSKQFHNSPVKRTRFAGLQRNTANAEKNATKLPLT